MELPIDHRPLPTFAVNDLERAAEVIVLTLQTNRTREKNVGNGTYGRRNGRA
jgi:hypothetical protein